MSIKYMTMVWESDRWEGTTLVMMLVLADFANDGGYCWPSVKTLAEKCRIQERQAKRIIRSLLNEDSPGIEQARAGNGAGHSSMYRLIAENIKKGVTQDTVIDEERVSSDTPLPEGRVSPEAKRVSSKTKKGVTGDTRSVIEPPIESLLPSAAPTPQTSGGDVPAESTKPEPTEHQKMFAKICEIVGWDYQTLDKRSKGEVAQTLGFLKDAKPPYTLADLNDFGRKVWALDWRWSKNKQRPTLTQLRQEIGKLRAQDFDAPGTNGTRPAATRQVADDGVNLAALLAQADQRPY